MVCFYCISTTVSYLMLNPLNTYIHHHHHHVVLLARISLILSRHFSISFIAFDRSSGLHPIAASHQLKRTSTRG